MLTFYLFCSCENSDSMSTSYLYTSRLLTKNQRIEKHLITFEFLYTHLNEQNSIKKVFNKNNNIMHSKI